MLSFRGLNHSLSHSNRVIKRYSRIKRFNKGPAHTPASTVTVKRLNFTSDEDVKERFESFFGGCRTGLLLEELDIISGAAAYKYVIGEEAGEVLVHNGSKTKTMAPHISGENVNLVTVSCSKLDSIGQIWLDNDLELEAKVVDVGKSSLEIYVTVSEIKKGVRERLISSNFTFAARNAEGQKYILPPIVLENDDDIHAQTKAKYQKKLKIERMNALKMDTEEHQFNKNKILRGLLNNFPDANLEMTKLRSFAMMHPQQKNIYGKIFGGFLMRMAFETAWSCVYLCTRKKPVLRTIDEQIFLAPVEIGSICLFSASVLHVEENEVHIKLKTDVTNPTTGEVKTTNIFKYVFSVL